MLQLKVFIWNHSSTQFPDMEHATVKGIYLEPQFPDMEHLQLKVSIWGNHSTLSLRNNEKASIVFSA